MKWKVEVRVILDIMFCAWYCFGHSVVKGEKFIRLFSTTTTTREETTEEEEEGRGERRRNKLIIILSTTIIITQQKNKEGKNRKYRVVYV